MQEAPLPLRDLHLPAEVGWWPLAPGWWVLIAIVAALAAYATWRAVSHWRFNAPRRFALEQLRRYEAGYLEHRNVVQLGRQVSELLRRGMLAYAPREAVAGLTGEAWLEWLDRDLPVPYFHTDGGRSLLTLPYRDPDSELADVDVSALLAAARMRLSIPQRRNG
jgi:hypothetical protein